MDWKNKPNQIFNKVKQQMYNKGVETFHFLDQHIQQFDPQQTHVLTSHFFNLFLNKVGVFLTTQEVRNIRDLYSQDKKQDLILYRNFLEDVKYSISQKIAALIGQAFDCIDSQAQGAISLETLASCYHEQQHPHCVTRRKSAENIKAEFMSGMQRKVNEEGKVTKQAFIDYYAELNFCIPSERQSYFEQLLSSTWNIKYSNQYVPEKRLREVEHTLFEKIRLKSDGKTSEWKTGKKALFYFDLEDKKKCNYDQFKKGMDKFGCNFQESEMKALFYKYAEEDSLDYQVFTKGIMNLDINGMSSQENLFQTKMGTNHFKVTH